nr:MAG TPA: hypothetical protein [Crassvirales sp.]
MKVVAIIYTGSELDSSAVSEIHKAINDFAVGGSEIVIKKYNEEDLLNLGLKTAVADIKFDSENEAVENAAIYISKKFESVLRKPVRLVLSMSEVKNSATREAEILKNAVSIISENSNNPILEKYGLSKTIVKVIVEFNTSYHA